VTVATVGDTAPRFYAYPISLARDASSGELGLAHLANGSNELWLANSTDGGATWKTEQWSTGGDSHEYLGPVLAMAKGVTHLAVGDVARSSQYLTRASVSGSFTVTPVPLFDARGFHSCLQRGRGVQSPARSGLRSMIQHRLDRRLDRGSTPGAGEHPCRALAVRAIHLTGNRSKFG
jgi:hypothetical protein